MASTPHVSRWQLCHLSEASNSSANSNFSLSSASEIVGKNSCATPPVSLRYLNEFVGKLHCAPALLQYELFPDAKEITESMALFNTVRRYINPGSNEEYSRAEKESKHDGIVVVGDGNTPRTAALFAFRMRGWTSYSVDPAMENGTSERSKRWTEISNLVVIRNKIEKVRITLRRAIVVLVHAHVTLDQALSAIQAEQICGVVTLPCCNWYGQQESLFGRSPDLVYDDFSVLSNHREIRLWVGDGSALGCLNGEASRTHLQLFSGVVKGCIRKDLVAASDDGYGVSTATNKSADEQAKLMLQQHDGVLDLISDSLSDVACDPPSMSQETHLSERQVAEGISHSAITSHLRKDDGVLVLCWHPRRTAVRSLLRDGYTNVYTILLAEKKSFRVIDDGRRGLKTLSLDLHKCNIINPDSNPGNEEKRGEERLQLDPCGSFTLESSFALHSNEKIDSEKEEVMTVSFNNAGLPTPRLTCIFDAGFVFRGFRGRSKKNPTFFHHVYRTLDRLLAACGSVTDNNTGPSLICLTSRKRWHKKKFLALEYDTQSFAMKEPSEGTPLFMYCCFKRHAVAAKVQSSIKETSSESTNTRDVALETWLALKIRLSTRKFELADKLIIIDSPEARMKAALDQERAVAEAPDTFAGSRKVYAQATGTITRIRRFSNGSAFVSFALASSRCDRPLQLFLQRDTLGFSISMFAKVAGLIRKGDELITVGFIARNARGHSMLQVEALSLARSGEFEAYN